MEGQAQKDKYHMILSHVESKTADHTEIRSRMVAARGGVGLGADRKLQSEKLGYGMVQMGTYGARFFLQTQLEENMSMY